ncbi:TadE/TadG family type IV pilus assembly protein [Pseudomonas borbori]|uniref:Putative Flp pilus-assembly TadE/G-like n=1 Tax=Pseudomonas borbori TaxID=289003 RepID=A0A1I5P8R1_9PSED|nr:Tad domain-containing protein [Pseudomonas borbori]SFP30425.1 Putative Flp pilus-assembly TadE/G-like [Pseudomonas borbori]
MMKPRMHRPFTTLPQRQRGAVIVLIVVAMLAILAMAALALDGGHMLVNKTRLQNAVDAAALSGAKTLSQVSGDPMGYLAAAAAARDTLTRNAYADGNGELADAIDAPDFVIEVKFSDSVYGSFKYPPESEDPRYVRVEVANYKLSEFLWGILRHPLLIGDGFAPNKAVAAIATAGPSPTASTCKIDPVVVCGDPAQYDPENGNFWGYRYGDLQTLTCGTPGSPSAGNCQLLRLGDSTGGADIRQAFCAGTEQCIDDTGWVDTEPGITWGPVAQGLNTRLGLYNGPVDPASCPPDWYTNYSEPLVAMDSGVPKQNGAVVVSANGDLSAGAAQLTDVNDWKNAYLGCAASPGSCSGVAERRVLNVVIGNCAAVAGGGATSVPVLGFGCFYLLQKVEQSGEKEVFGQFMRECEGSGYAGPEPAEDVGPQIIQLYKTYIGEGVRESSHDS